MKLVITTQFWENYGSPHNPYWKAKGGNDYFVKNVTAETALDFMMSVKNVVEHWGDYTKEYIIGWSVEADDYLTPFEQDQLKYDGKINYPAEELML
jgi:hypothetical protein